MPQNRLRRFKLIQAQAQSYWKQCSSEYLPQCQRRGKWTKLTRNIEIGDLAVLKNDNSPPLQWDLVRVTKVHPGPDGIVRAVTVRNCSGSEFKRAAIKLVVHPLKTIRSEKNRTCHKMLYCISCSFVIIVKYLLWVVYVNCHF